jgi:hypothetical protein
MDVDREIDFLGGWLRSIPTPNPSLLQSLVVYCEKTGLCHRMGYAFIEEHLNSVIVSVQQTLHANIESAMNLNECSKSIEKAELMLPAALHRFIRFARDMLEFKSTEVENKFKVQLNGCATVKHLTELAHTVARELLPSSSLHEEISQRISQRQECLRFEILTMYDHPVTSGCIPELEAAALEYSQELPERDPVLLNFSIGICFYFLKMRKEMNSYLDIRSELKAFTWCKKIGAEHVLPILKSNLTSTELKSVIPVLVKRLCPGDDSAGGTGNKVFQSQVFRIRGLVTLDTSDDIPTGTDYGSIWDIFPPDFTLPGNDLVSKPDEAATVPGKTDLSFVNSIPSQPQDPKLPSRLCLNKELSQIPYTPFKQRQLVSQSEERSSKKYFVTLYPSKSTVRYPLVPKEMLVDRTVNEKESTCT